MKLQNPKNLTRFFISLLIAVAAMSVVSCETDWAEIVPTTYTLENHRTKDLDITIYEYDDYDNFVGSSQLYLPRSTSSGISSTSTSANSSATHITIKVNNWTYFGSTRWIDRIYYLTAHKDLRIPITDDLEVSSYEP